MKPLWHTGSSATEKQRSEKIFLPKTWPLINQFFESTLPPKKKIPKLTVTH